jgi:endoglucanase
MLVKNLLAAAALAATAFASPFEKRQNSTRKLKWFGINESGAEFGEKNFTGVYGTEYIWYDLNTIDVSLFFLSPQPDHQVRQVHNSL